MSIDTATHVLDEIQFASDDELRAMAQRVSREVRLTGVGEFLLNTIKAEIDNRRKRKNEVIVEFVTTVPDARPKGRGEAPQWNILRENPKQWAVIHKSDYRYSPKKKTSFQFTTRLDKATGKYFVYARYMPPSPLAGAALAAKEGRLLRDENGRTIGIKPKGRQRDSNGRFLPSGDA